MQAQDVMTTAVATIHADATVKDAAKLMLERRISALPVVDAKDRVIGIVSEGVRSNGEQKVLHVAAKAVAGVRSVEDHTFVMPLRVAAALGPV